MATLVPLKDAFNQTAYIGDILDSIATFLGDPDAAIPLCTARIVDSQTGEIVVQDGQALTAKHIERLRNIPMDDYLDHIALFTRDLYIPDHMYEYVQPQPDPAVTAVQARLEAITQVTITLMESYRDDPHLFDTQLQAYQSWASTLGDIAEMVKNPILRDVLDTYGLFMYQAANSVDHLVHGI